VHVERLSDYLWRIPPDAKPGMRVPGLVYADDALMAAIRRDGSLEQVANAATLPGIVKASLAMPDIHQGYGLPVGGVVATDAAHGVISPGGVGYDINCGVRLCRTNLSHDDVRPRLPALVEALARAIPAGVGSRGRVRLSPAEERRGPVIQGARWAVARGYGEDDELARIESHGTLEGADPDAVSPRAYERGRGQLGTLGSGNHFVEVQVVDEVLAPEAAAVLGLEAGQVTVMIHTGSRGFGHQVCSDALNQMQGAMRRYGITLPDRQLACAPLDSPEARSYLGAMRGAANFAFANRQCLAHWTREAFEQVLGMSPRDLGLTLVYDVAHNIAKVERYKEGELVVHRKGATRAFGPGQPELPERFRKIGQPVICGGSMETGSYLLVGTHQAMEETFGSTMHGSGRTMSRAQAKRSVRGEQLQKDMQKRGIIVKAVSMSGLAEEAGFAYKNISDVVEAVDRAGITKKVAELRPIGNIKG